MLVASHLRRNKPALQGQGKLKYLSEERQSPVCVQCSYHSLLNYILFSVLTANKSPILALPKSRKV